MTSKLKEELEVLDELLLLSDPKGMLPRMVIRKRNNFSRKLKPAKSHSEFIDAAPKVRAHLAKGVAMFGTKSAKSKK